MVIGNYFIIYLFNAFLDSNRFNWCCSVIKFEIQETKAIDYRAVKASEHTTEMADALDNLKPQMQLITTETERRRTCIT
jgi:hypothetical protein